MRKLIICILCFGSYVSQSCFAAMPAASKVDMVVTDQHLATQAGVDILRAGGNAVDAAVAVGYALAVTNPCCGNIGGGGFMLLHLTGDKNIFINFRERAPLAASAKMYLDKNGQVIPHASTYSYLAVATPGTVLGLDTALTQFGSMTRKQIMAPAIKLARDGFVLIPGDISLLNSHLEEFKKSPNVARIFLNHGKPFVAGEKLIQTDLANTLQSISEHGTKAFYSGKIANAIVQASQQNGGILSEEDFKKYYVELMTPLNCKYRGYAVIAAPPPSSGGVSVCEILNILEGYPLSTYPWHGTQGTHYITEAMRYAFADRNMQLGDPDFVKNPVEHLISKTYAASIRSKIPATQAVNSTSIHFTTVTKEGVHTTHYSIVDKWGNAAAVTYTLNTYFGTNLIAGDTGFFLNNEMDDFTAKSGVPNQFGLVEGNKNDIAPGKRPLSSMAPTIILQDDKPLLITGSPGGPRIITTALETILNVLDYHMNIQDAADAPRFHHQWLPDIIQMEPGTFSGATQIELIKAGYHFKVLPMWGASESIYIDPQTKINYGANDRRRWAGLALGE
jgi:gamma-glutamyltranspeptidase/glutathione hydrolase